MQVPHTCIQSSTRASGSCSAQPCTRVENFSIFSLGNQLYQLTTCVCGSRPPWHEKTVDINVMQWSAYACDNNQPTHVRTPGPVALQAHPSPLPSPHAAPCNRVCRFLLLFYYYLFYGTTIHSETASFDERATMTTCVELLLLLRICTSNAFMVKRTASRTSSLSNGSSSVLYYVRSSMSKCFFLLLYCSTVSCRTWRPSLCTSRAYSH